MYGDDDCVFAERHAIIKIIIYIDLWQERMKHVHSVHGAVKMLAPHGCGRYTILTDAYCRKAFIRLRFLPVLKPLLLPSPVAQKART
jgi:hypothetical protein